MVAILVNPSLFTYSGSTYTVIMSKAAMPGPKKFTDDVEKPSTVPSSSGYVLVLVPRQAYKYLQV